MAGKNDQRPASEQDDLSQLLQVAVPELLWSLIWSPLVWLLFRAIHSHVGGTKLA